MDYKWITNGLQMDYKWITNGLQIKQKLSNIFTYKG